MSSRFAILNPCSKRWSDLTGKGRERFCQDCQTSIHAVEQYSAQEIDELERESPGRLCGYLAGESLPPPRSRRAVLMGALLTAISPLMAQAGRVRIRVTDAAGDVLPGAEVWLLGKGGELILTERANQIGEIVLTGLRIGDWRIVLSCSGFKNLPLTVTIRNADELKLDAKLEVGSELVGNFHKKSKRWWIFR